MSDLPTDILPTTELNILYSHSPYVHIGTLKCSAIGIGSSTVLHSGDSVIMIGSIHNWAFIPVSVFLENSSDLEEIFFQKRTNNVEYSSNMCVKCKKYKNTTRLYKSTYFGEDYGIGNQPKLFKLKSIFCESCLSQELIADNEEVVNKIKQVYTATQI